MKPTIHRGGLRRALAACAFVLSPLAALAQTTVFCGTGASNCSDSPMAGAITASSAMVWLRLNANTPVRLRWQYAGDPTWVMSDFQTPGDEVDRTARFTLPNLVGATTYAYQVGITQADGSETWSPSFYFHTQDARPKTLSFSVLSDFVNNLYSSAALRTATAQKNDMLFVIGDLDHRNPAMQSPLVFFPPNDPGALANMRKMHQTLRHPSYPIGADFYNGILASPSPKKPQVPLYYVWDDHDFCANNTGSDCPSRDVAFQAYRENYLWAADSGLNGSAKCGQDGVFQRIPVGALADIIMLDARSGRIDDSRGPLTMLGTCQMNWLKTRLKQSTAVWKIVLSPVPLNPKTKTWDGWGHFPAEHQQFVSFVAAAGIKNVIVMSGDIHTGGAYDDGSHSGLPEFSVPHANMSSKVVDTYCLPKPDPLTASEATLDEPGTWTIGSLASPNTGAATPKCLGVSPTPGLLDPLPPPPYPLAGTNQPGFVRIDLTATTATFQVIGYDGVLRRGVTADGTDTPLAVVMTAQ